MMSERELSDRIERIERKLGLGKIKDDPDWKPFRVCERKGHAMHRVQYDLQGGKWGVEQCERCGHEVRWSV